MIVIVTWTEPIPAAPRTLLPRPGAHGRYRDRVTDYPSNWPKGSKATTLEDERTCARLKTRVRLGSSFVLRRGALSEGPPSGSLLPMFLPPFCYLTGQTSLLLPHGADTTGDFKTFQVAPSLEMIPPK